MVPITSHLSSTATSSYKENELPRQTKFRYLLRILVLIFCVLNVVLYWKIMNVKTSTDYHQWAKNKSKDFDIINRTGRFDNNINYVINDFVYVSDSWSQRPIKNNVCVATQTSVEHLFRLVEMSQAWQGPISTAVYIPSTEYHVAQIYLRFLIQCFPSVKENVSFHFVYPVDQPPEHVPELLNWTSNCSLWKDALKQLCSFLPKDFATRNTKPYPQNHLRNVARKNCYTQYVYLLDVDIIPKNSLAQNLNSFLQQSPTCDNCAYVIPTYEVYESNGQLPENKTSLLKLVKKNQAQPFHRKVFALNQNAINASRWEKLPQSKEIQVAYPVTDYKFLFEPFYVALDTVPPHDERFVGYGFTRNTQVR
ncbi:hypothetical protein CHUAL_004096 [Chamberlinius hualienensis]